MLFRSPVSTASITAIKINPRTAQSPDLSSVPIIELGRSASSAGLHRVGGKSSVWHYSTTHLEPEGTVTVTPDEIEIGPAETALDPEVIVYVALTVCVFS